MNANLSKILGKETEEKWVALTRDRKELIDFSEDLSELRGKLGKKRNDYVYMRVLRSDIEYSFALFSWKKR